MSRDEILTHNFNQTRGYEMLRVVLHWVDVAISQQLILGPGVERIRFLNKLAEGESELDVAPYPYAGSDPIGKLFPDMQQSVISLRYGRGSYDPRWVNQMHKPYALGYYQAWSECFGVSVVDCEYRLNGGEPSYSDRQGFQREALGVIGSKWLFPVGKPSETAVLELANTHPEMPDDSDEIKQYLRSEFVLYVDDWYGEFSLDANEWQKNSANFLGPWVRAERSRRLIIDQMAFEEQTPHENVLQPWVEAFGPGDEQTIWECEEKLFEFFENAACHTPEAWSDWTQEKQEQLTNVPSSIEFNLFDIHRDPATGKFQSEVEALLDLKAALLRHLTPYRIYQDQDVALKQRWIDSLTLNI